MKNTLRRPETRRIPGGTENLLCGGLDRVVTREEGVASARLGALSRRTPPPQAGVAARYQSFCTDWFMPSGQERRAGDGRGSERFAVE